MNYRTFGKTGWQVSEIGFGGWAIGAAKWGTQDDQDSLKALHRALDLGVTFIDTAQAYGNGHSERLISRVLKERGEKIGNGKIRVATKTPPLPLNSTPITEYRSEDPIQQAYLREKVEYSLKNMDAEVLDLVQLHTWTRAWNRKPVALDVLQDLKKEGKLLAVGVSTPEHDQNSLIEPMRQGKLDAVQVIYNIFEQEPRAEFLPIAEENRVGVIVRVVFDEGSLTGKFDINTTFEKDDFRNLYFKGDRLQDTVKRVEKIKQTITKFGFSESDLPSIAIRFALQHSAVSTVIPGIRNVEQAEKNCTVSDLAVLPTELYEKLQKHIWRRGFWYAG